MSDFDQVRELLLTDPDTGEPLKIVSDITANPDGSFSFEVADKPGACTWKITIRIEEITKGEKGGQ